MIAVVLAVLVLIAAVCGVVAIAAHRRELEEERRAAAVAAHTADMLKAAGFVSELEPGEPDGINDFWENAVAGLPADVLRAIEEGPTEGTETPADPAAPVEVRIYADDTPQTLAGRYGRHVAAIAWAEYSRGASSRLIVWPTGRSDS